VNLGRLPGAVGSGALDGRGSGSIGALGGMAGADQSRSGRHTLTEFQSNLESIREKLVALISWQCSFPQLVRKFSPRCLVLLAMHDNG
jgi:hypothetical protein